jgi:hypothetical protein
MVVLSLQGLPRNILPIPTRHTTCITKKRRRRVIIPDATNPNLERGELALAAYDFSTALGLYCLAI